MSRMAIFAASYVKIQRCAKSCEVRCWKRENIGSAGALLSAPWLSSCIPKLRTLDIVAELAVELLCELKKNECFSRLIPYPSCESPFYLELLWVEVVRRMIFLVPNAGESVGGSYGYICVELR